jgi:hypothetical protein
MGRFQADRWQTKLPHVRMVSFYAWKAHLAQCQRAAVSSWWLVWAVWCLYLVGGSWEAAVCRRGPWGWMTRRILLTSCDDLPRGCVPRVQEPAFVNVKTAATTLFGGGSRTGANQQQPHVRVFIFFFKKKRRSALLVRPTLLWHQCWRQLLCLRMRSRLANTSDKQTSVSWSLHL